MFCVTMPCRKCVASWPERARRRRFVSFAAPEGGGGGGRVVVDWGVEVLR